MELNQITDATVQSLVEVGKLAAAPTEVQNAAGISVPYIIVGGKVTPLPDLKFNEHAKNPERIKANVTVLDPESFINYYALFSDLHSRVFADEAHRSVLAILDYHEEGTAASEESPRWGSHRITLALRHSEEWQTWINGNNKQMTQQQFAEFLEQNSVDITDPAGGTLREIAEDLETTVDVDFASAQRQAGGRVAFKYTETTKTTVSGGQVITVPDNFSLGIPVFVGGPRVGMGAFLRYRIKEQKLVFFYTLMRPEEVVRAAFAGARQAIADGIGSTIINGTP
jgi:uncharacterized protein YfdQ (DUF2303 family)